MQHFILYFVSSGDIPKELKLFDGADLISTIDLHEYEYCLFKQGETTITTSDIIVTGEYKEIRIERGVNWVDIIVVV